VTAPTTYETQARTRKAVVLAQSARDHGFTARQVAEDAEIRTQLVVDTGVREPSLTTWAVVVTLLETDDSASDVQDLIDADREREMLDPPMCALDQFEERYR